MKKKLRATVTIVEDYEADSRDYLDCEVVEDIIEIDTKNFDDNPIMFIDGMLDKKIKATIKIEEVKD